MSAKEADRVSVVRKLEAKRLRQREAAERLGLSVRQCLPPAPDQAGGRH